MRNLRYSRGYSRYKKDDTHHRFKNLFARKSRRRTVLAESVPLWRAKRHRSKASAGASRAAYVGTFLPLLIISWLALMLYLPFFRISHISYSGLKITKPEEIQAAAASYLAGRHIIPANNYFMLGTESLAAFLRARLSLKAVTVTKTFPDNLNIAIDEKISAVIYDTGEKYYLLDNSGSVLKYLTDAAPASSSSPDRGGLPARNASASMAGGGWGLVSSSSTAPITSSSQKIAGEKISVVTSSTTTTHVPEFVKIKREFGNYPILYYLHANTSAQVNDHILKPEIIKGVIAAANQLEQGRIAKVNYAVYDNEGSGVVLNTDKGWTLSLRPTADISAQIQNLKTILQSSHPAQYVDVRFGERVYWK